MDVGLIFSGLGRKASSPPFQGSRFASADSQKWLAGLKGRKLYRSDGGSLNASRPPLGVCGSPVRAGADVEFGAFSDMGAYDTRTF
jgi:hypothetical protein